MDRHLTFVQFTDTHITPTPADRVYGADTVQHFREAVAAVRAMDLRPTFFLISGDLTRDGETESYQLLATLIEDLAGFEVPVLLGLGNHDRRVPFRQVMLGDRAAADEEEPYYYSRRIGDLRVLMLDSKVTGEIWGRLGDRQLRWLADQLESPAPGGDLIVVHHPVLPRGVPRPDDYLLQDADRLGDVIEGRRVLGILSGHSHVSSVACFRGTLAATAPATAFLLDPTVRDGVRVLDGAGFNVGTARDGRLIVNPIILPGSQAELFRQVEETAALEVPAGQEMAGAAH